MNYEKFATFLDKRLHVDEKKSLLQKLADAPDRFVGDFRASKPIAKLNQFVSQSREIKFGDAIEEAIGFLLQDCMESENLPKRILSFDGEELNLDQYFKRHDTYYFVEQKIRDDHDSTKKRGQMQNFIKKYEVLKQKHPDIVGMMYFIDPSLNKNSRYYQAELAQLRARYGTEDIHIFYGKAFFDYFDCAPIWDDLLSWLREYRDRLPDVASFNYDEDPQSTYDELVTLKPIYWQKIIHEQRLWESGILHELFKTGETLQRIQQHLNTSAKTKPLSIALKDRLQQYY